MFCPKCGCPNNDNAIFCKDCGTRLTAPKQAPTYPQQQTPLSYQCTSNNQQQSNSNKSVHSFQPASVPRTTEKKSFSTNPIINELKKMGTSPLFLIAIICLSVSLLFRLFTAFDGGDLFALYDILDETGLDYYLNDLIRPIRSFATSLTLLQMLPLILVCIGFWMIFAASINRNTDQFSTSGLTMLRVVVMIQMVGVCIVAGVVLIALIATTAEISSYVYDDSVIAWMAFLILLLAALFTLWIMYYAKILKIISTIKYTATMARPSAGLSTFVPVMNFISAGVTFINSFSGEGITILSAWAQAAFMIMISIFLFQYRTKMQELQQMSIPSIYDVKLDNTSWKCPKCGKINKNYVTTCTCGESKHL